MTTSEKLSKAQELLQATMALENANATKNVCQKLARKIKADLMFLRNRGEQHKGDDVQLASSNLPYLEGVLQTVQCSSEVTDVICDIKKYGIVVDVICDDGKTWKKIIARNPQSLYLIWAGKGQYGTKDIMKKAEKYVEASKQSCEFSPPRIMFVFCNGVTHPMADALEQLYGIVVEGDRLNVAQETLDRLRMVGIDSDSDSEDLFERARSQELNRLTVDETVPLEKGYSTTGTEEFARVKNLPVDQKIFLDITTMIVYVSEVCNGGSIAAFNDKILEEQAASERRESALKKIRPYMEGRQLITCESAINDFKGVLKVLAGENECTRAEGLMKSMIVVPDWMSDRCNTLVESGQIRYRSKVIFGTADRLCCDILTSNVGFLRAAAGQGVNISARAHDSRALSEKKENKHCHTSA